MRQIIIFQKWTEEKKIQEILPTNLQWARFTKYNNIYISEDNWKARCSVEITIPWRIRSTAEFKLDEYWEVKEDEKESFESRLSDFCQDIQIEEYDIDLAEVELTPLENKKIKDIRMWDKLKSLLKDIFNSDEIELKTFSWIYFFWDKNEYLNFDSNFAPTDEALKNFI